MGFSSRAGPGAFARCRAACVVGRDHTGTSCLPNAHRSSSSATSDRRQKLLRKPGMRTLGTCLMIASAPARVTPSSVARFGERTAEAARWSASAAIASGSESDRRSHLGPPPASGRGKWWVWVRWVRLVGRASRNPRRRPMFPLRRALRRQWSAIDRYGRARGVPRDSPLDRFALPLPGANAIRRGGRVEFHRHSANPARLAGPGPFADTGACPLGLESRTKHGESLEQQDATGSGEASCAQSSLGQSCCVARVGRDATPRSIAAW
jgi:hypothetical protein